MSDPENTRLSRRQFLELTGGVAGMAALTSFGIANGWADNKVTLDAENLSKQDHQTDVLVIGGGMAGLFAAVKAHDAGARVMLVSKGRLGASGQTPFAKGIFAFNPKTSRLTLDQFTNEVSRSALGTSNPVYTRQMAEHSLARVNELKDWGFFDSVLYNRPFSNPLQKRNIPVIERVMITHLIKEDGKIVGAAGLSMDNENVISFSAKSIILCTGAGGFKPNGFPINDLTHDGTVMAYKIGAKVTGKEWNDGHPGQEKNAAACFDGWHGMFERKPGITGVEIHHDLGVDMNYLAYMNGNPLEAGPPGMAGRTKTVGGPYRPEGFDQPHHPPPPPGGDFDRVAGRGKPPAGFEPPPGGPPEGGRPPGMHGIPVGGSSAGMSIHKSEGLVPINDQCESTIPGLYAAGDALGSYMAGAIYTQIGSSLAGSAVQGAIAGKAAAKYARKTPMFTISSEKLNQVKDEILAPLKREAGYGPAWVTQTLQGIMIPNFVLYIKKESLLQAALAYIEELRDHHMPMLRAADMHELRLAHETANMIISAEMKLKASLMRKESRCSHFRLDYPQIDNENWQAWINIYRGNKGEMQLEKQRFDAWPV